jgi:hypothetical protein
MVAVICIGFFAIVAFLFYAAQRKFGSGRSWQYGWYASGGNMKAERRAPRPGEDEGRAPENMGREGRPDGR